MNHSIDKVNSNTISISYSSTLHQILDINFYYNYTVTKELLDDDGKIVSTYEKTMKKFLFEVVDDKIHIKYGLLEFLIMKLVLNGIDYTLNITNNANITINDKWNSVLNTDFRVVEGKNQYDYLKSLLEVNRALAQIYTSYGKTELLLAIAESYLDENPDKNVIIMIPSDSIKSEFYERHEKWEVKYKIEYHKFKNKINLVNPIGLRISGKFDDDYSDEDFSNYTNNVGLVLIDEVHHLSANSYIMFLDQYLNNYDYIYGVSGTVNSESGYLPKISDNIYELETNVIRLISYLSIPRLNIKNPVQLLVAYLRLELKTVPKFLSSNYGVNLNILFNSDKLAIELIKFLKANPNRRMFIPVYSKKNGTTLAKKLMAALGEDSVIMHGSGVNYPKLDVKYEGNWKNFLKNPKFRVLLGTSAIFEGLDSSRVNCIFSGIGVNNKMAIQPTGRSVRSDDQPLLIFPYDTNKNNHVINSQTRSKYKKVKEQYDNTKFIQIQES